MSRVGKLPIAIPKGVTVNVVDSTVTVEGPKGNDQHKVPGPITVAVSGGVVTVTRASDDNAARSLHGLVRRLVANSIAGVSVGFTRTLEIVGVGYRAEVKGKALQLTLGYSHPIIYQFPPGIDAKVDKQVIVTIEGNNKQLLGEVCAQIRALRPPEPYKGKGIKYAGEQIRRKAGKAAGAAGR